MRDSTLLLLFVCFVAMGIGCTDESNRGADASPGGAVQSMMDMDCIDACTAKGTNVEVCTETCGLGAAGGMDDSNATGTDPVDQNCLEMCIAKGETENTCMAACGASDKGDEEEPSQPNVNQACFDACTAKGEAEDVCLAACSAGGQESGKDMDAEGGKDVLGSSLPITEFTVNGIDHVYRIFVPDNPPAAPMPLLIAVHGGDGRNIAFEQEARFVELAQSEGIVLAFPMSAKLPENEGEWILNTAGNSRQDIDFMGGMIDHISERHSVDASRIYATGYSLGSMFVYELVCHMSDRFAAVASYAGSMPVSPQECQPARNVSIMHIHGVLDPTIPYGETWDWKEWPTVGTMRDIPSLIDYWKTAYECQDEQSSDTGDTVHTIHRMCSGNARVEHYRLNQVDHDWPTSIDGTSTHRVIWNFLSNFSNP